MRLLRSYGLKSWGEESDESFYNLLILKIVWYEIEIVIVNKLFIMPHHD